MIISYCMVPGISTSPTIPSHLPVQPDDIISYNPHPSPASEAPPTVGGISSGEYRSQIQSFRFMNPYFD